MIPSIKHMRGQRADIQLACRNKSSQFFHAESSARHQASVNLFVTHSNAPLYTRNINVVTGSKIVYISDLSARFQAFYCFCKGFYTTAGDDYFINTFSICHIKYLLENRSVLVADKIRCAVFFCRFYADRSRSDSNDSRCAAHIRSGYRHQTNWSDSDNKNCITKLYIGKLYAVESGRHHIGKHARVDNIDVFRKQRKVSIGIIYMKEFRKDTIFEVGEFPACQHSAGVHGITSLCFQRIPVRSDGRHKNPVSRFEIFYELSDFHNLCTALMAQNHVMTVTDGPFP